MRIYAVLAVLVNPVQCGIPPNFTANSRIGRETKQR